MASYGNVWQSYGNVWQRIAIFTIFTIFLSFDNWWQFLKMFDNYYIFDTFDKFLQFWFWWISMMFYIVTTTSASIKTNFYNFDNSLHFFDNFRQNFKVWKCRSEQWNWLLHRTCQPCVYSNLHCICPPSSLKKTIGCQKLP